MIPLDTFDEKVLQAPAAFLATTKHSTKEKTRY